MAEIKLEKTQEPAKLRIYIGAAPGVGKTYDMINDAYNMKHQQGVDVVIGWWSRRTAGYRRAWYLPKARFCASAGVPREKLTWPGHRANLGRGIHTSLDLQGQSAAYSCHGELRATAYAPIPPARSIPAAACESNGLVLRTIESSPGSKSAPAPEGLHPDFVFCNVMNSRKMLVANES